MGKSELFTSLYEAVVNGAVYSYGVQISGAERMIVLVKPGKEFACGEVVAFKPEEAERFIKVYFAGYTSKKEPNSRDSSATLSPEELGMRYAKTPHELVGFRVKNGLVEFFITPPVDLETQKALRFFELHFIELNKTVSLTPSSLKL